MKAPLPPRLDERRTSQFRAELLERARAWLPSWGLDDNEHDFGRALLEIAARFNSEVAERLDGAGEKMRRGFLDWLAVRGEAARPARMPVVFKLSDSAQEAVLASAPVRMQADAAGTPVVFETERDVRIVPGRLDVVVGVDADKDAFYLPPPGLSDLKPLEPLPKQWQLKAFASVGSITIQLDPETGLKPDTILEVGGQQYRIVKADKDLVTIEPPLVAELAGGTSVFQVTAFSPFDGKTRNQQAHALYLGDTELLNVEAEATIEVVGATNLVTGVTWQYWGKVDDKDEVGWQTLTLQKTVSDAVVLTKPKGAIEPFEIDGKNSRWIRAYRKTVGATDQPFTNDQISLRINPSGCDPNATPCANAPAIESPVAEAMANTTPLVLDNVFFPLGKEPRQFDAFYLGSKEAFSKKEAKAQLCFEMADPTFFALSAVKDGVFKNTVLAGTAKDRALHLFRINSTGGLSKLREREPLQPPAPGYDGKVEPGPSVTLDQPFRSAGPSEMRSRWRPPVWADIDYQIFGLTFSGFLVAVSAGDAIWVWHEHSASPRKSGWISLGNLPPTSPAATEDTPVAGLVYLAGPPVAPPLVRPAKIFALRNGQIAMREWPNGTGWEEVETIDSVNGPVRLEAIVPVLDEAAGFAPLIANGMVGVSAGNLLYRVTENGDCTKLSPTDVDFGVRPVAVKDASGKLRIAFAHTSLRDLVMFHEDHLEADIELKEADAQVVGFDAAASSTGLHFFASVAQGDTGYLASWAPQTTAVAKISYARATLPINLGSFGGAPTEVSNHIVIPGTRGDSFVAKFDPTKRIETSAAILPGIVLPSSAPTLVPNDLVMRMKVNTPEGRAITDYGIREEGEVFYPIEAAFTSAVPGPLLAYKASAPLTGKALAVDELELKSGDFEATENSIVLINDSFHTIKNLNKDDDPWVATVKPDNLTVGTALYSKPIPTGGRTAPFMSLGATNNNWEAALLKRVPLLFPGAVPEEQQGKAFSTDASGHPLVVALAQEFTTVALGNAKFVVDATVGEWTQIREDTTANPELSWEYWNGKGWWKLNVTLDDTQNLKTSGALQFDVPSDIASSDWAGKTNFWIRARLIGGDYGREKITARTKDLGGGVTEQTIDRSSEGIRAPSVLKLTVSYAVCKSVSPTYVQAQDSGTIRDQSDANRTAGAIVEAFVPLAIMLGRLSKNAASIEPGEECPPECDCKSQHPTAPAADTDAPIASPQATPPASGRAIFIGLNATPSEAPINVLLLVDEQNHTAFAPMQIEALVADRFLPIVADDATRALGESGLLSMAFTIPPTRRDLFGKKALTWLRLTPKANANGNWIPTLRGAYLNAAWASATETLTRELLGSSDGAPNLTVRLARPPVLRNTLELRVKEPLGEEERQALLDEDAESVLSAVEGLPGDWVLWKQVTDPDDEPATARVYALDEATGEIRFGDGVHGKIPPIGRDAIVAFSYARTEPDPTGGDSVPGNNIAARTALNLVSPVETVETVTTADQAAGGAPPESDERVLRYGFARLRHRSRAVTTQDIEDLALQSSPDIVQARAEVRRGHIRLVVVMRGKNPVPNAAQVRELRRLLLADGPTALGAPNALRIEGPGIRKLRIDLQLQVETLDQAGDVGVFVKNRLAAFFDAATGGIDNDGWPMGVNPSEDDIAFALVDSPDLDGIADVKLRESTDGSDELPWPETLKPTEMVMLADDSVRIQFETAEVMA